MKKLRIAWDRYIVMSIAFYIAGLLYMTLPEISPLTVCITNGIFLIILGVIMLCRSECLIPLLLASHCWRKALKTTAL